jgi:hypothetical protein
MRLVANHRIPLMRQTQKPHEAKEPTVTKSKQCFAAGIGGCGTVGLVIGFAPSTPTAIAARKKNECVTTSQ